MAGTDDHRPDSPDASAAATCDACGSVVHFEGPRSGVVTFFPATGETVTLCATCSADADKERQWRETGVWVGSDLPPSLRSARPATPEELRRLLGMEPAPDDKDGGAETAGDDV